LLQNEAKANCESPNAVALSAKSADGAGARLRRLPVSLLLGNSPRLTGLYQRTAPDELVTHRYNYSVVRLWREGPESHLHAGVALVPPPMLTIVREKSLSGLVQLMAKPLEAHA
jgi:hypothetical protein